MNTKITKKSENKMFLLQRMFAIGILIGIAVTTLTSLFFYHILTIEKSQKEFMIYAILFGGLVLGFIQMVCIQKHIQKLTTFLKMDDQQKKEITGDVPLAGFPIRPATKDSP